MSVRLIRLASSPGDIITLNDAFIFASGVTPAGAAAAYTLDSTGDIRQSVNASSTDIGDWIIPKVRMSAYECRATLQSGTLTSGTTGTWLALSGSRSWALSRIALGQEIAQLLLEIRRASDQQVLASATITLEVIVEAG